MTCDCGICGDSIPCDDEYCEPCYRSGRVDAERTNAADRHDIENRARQTEGY